jgi:hypothetical protein
MQPTAFTISRASTRFRRDESTHVAAPAVALTRLVDTDVRSDQGNVSASPPEI